MFVTDIIIMLQLYTTIDLNTIVFQMTIYHVYTLTSPLPKLYCLFIAAKLLHAIGPIVGMHGTKSDGTYNNNSCLQFIIKLVCDLIKLAISVIEFEDLSGGGGSK